VILHDGDVTLLMSLGGVFYMVLLCWMCDGDILDDWMELALYYVPFFYDVDMVG
jgi:hypothetical protein